MYDIKITDTILDIDHAEWDSLSGESPMASYGWLRTVEETSDSPLNPKYILLHNAGRLVGATVFYIIKKNSSFYDMDSFLFRRLKKHFIKIGISFLPAAVCCPMFNDTGPFLIDPDADRVEYRKICKHLIETVETTSIGLYLSTFYYNVNGKSELGTILHSMGYLRAPGLSIHYMDIAWDSFNGYRKHVRSISKRAGKNINCEINKNKKKGVDIKKLPSTCHEESRIYELINHNYLSHNARNFPFKKNFVSKLIQNLGENCTIYTAFLNGNITGACISIRQHVTSCITFVGVDPELSKNDFTYFNITYYRPIKDAIAEKFKKLYFGKSMSKMKTRRGCSYYETCIFYRPRNLLSKIFVKLWFAFLNYF